MRTKTYSANDITLLNRIGFQQVTGYRVSVMANRFTEGEAGSQFVDHFRTLEGAKITRQVLDYERRALVNVNRARSKRYEISLTAAGRAIALKYRAKPFIPR